jgi:cytochrome c553
MVHGSRFAARGRRSFLVACVVAGGLLVCATEAQTTRTVWDGVYTEAQAERGRSSYEQACRSCHRDDLRGDNTAPSLMGESFLFLWGDMKVGELSARIRKLMPPERPGSLSAENYTDIVAFILQKNGFPAGSTELGADADSLDAPITPKPLGP